MTAIAGFVHDGVVWMGGDSAAVAGYDVNITVQPKVFVRHSAWSTTNPAGQPFLFGYTSSFRMGQLLEYSLEIPERQSGVSVEKYLATSFVNAVRTTMKEGGWAEKRSEQESAGCFLIGYAGRLFRMNSDYCFTESAHGYDAVGCGSELAMGALFVLQSDPVVRTSLAPEKRLRIALQAAQRHSGGVAGPFKILNV
jgi:hypothetical protein